MIAVLSKPPAARLFRGRRVWLVVAAWSALALAVAGALRSDASSEGASRVLLGVYGGLALPLMTYALVGATLGPRSLAASTRQLTIFGAPPARTAAVALAVAMAACTLASGVLAAILAVVAHGSADPPILRDAFTSAYAGGLGGAAYAGWFGLGASFGRRGGGRTVFLAADWILGVTRGAGALPVPRAHLRNLLGGAPPMNLPERTSALALLVLAGGCLALASLRARRT